MNRLKFSFILMVVFLDGFIVAGNLAKLIPLSSDKGQWSSVFMALACGVFMSFIAWSVARK